VVCLLSFDRRADLMRKAVELGADVVGAISHYELTREDGVESVRFAMALAQEHGLRVDIHCDETDDEHSRFVEVMAPAVGGDLSRGAMGSVRCRLGLLIARSRVRVSPAPRASGWPLSAGTADRGRSSYLLRDRAPGDPAVRWLR